MVHYLSGIFFKVYGLFAKWVCNEKRQFVEEFPPLVLQCQFKGGKTLPYNICYVTLGQFIYFWCWPVGSIHLLLVKIYETLLSDYWLLITQKKRVGHFKDFPFAVLDRLTLYYKRIIDRIFFSDHILEIPRRMLWFFYQNIESNKKLFLIFYVIGQKFTVLSSISNYWLAFAWL